MSITRQATNPVNVCRVNQQCQYIHFLSFFISPSLRYIVRTRPINYADRLSAKISRMTTEWYVHDFNLIAVFDTRYLIM